VSAIAGVAGPGPLEKWAGTGRRARRISVGTAHAYTAAVVDLLADRAPGLLRALREADPDYVLVDGTLAECDRIGDSGADFSHKHRRHGGERAGGDRSARGGAVDLARAARPCA
jgi:hypothetical protein